MSKHLKKHTRLFWLGVIVLGWASLCLAAAVSPDRFTNSIPWITLSTDR